MDLKTVCSGFSVFFKYSRDLHLPQTCSAAQLAQIATLLEQLVEAIDRLTVEGGQSTEGVWVNIYFTLRVLKTELKEPAAPVYPAPPRLPLRPLHVSWLPAIQAPRHSHLQVCTIMHPLSSPRHHIVHACRGWGAVFGFRMGRVDGMLSPVA